MRRRRRQEQQQTPTRAMCDASGSQLLPPPPSHIIGANDTTSSIYSTTPMTHHTYGSPRNSTTAVGAVNEDRNSRLAESTFMWMLQPSSSPSLASADHGSNRITESLLAQQLSEEDGTASVKYAERRPVTVQSIPHLVASDHELTATLVDDSHSQQQLQQQQQPPRPS
ncbi:hypothetical protein BCR43DRAFT_486005 [Syncephalastrum racemosum]|uniref:Uncharacterized protein n=1 Tax=Syncephalastrum racemosum TaxID=13706 RepID=A0A1X2HND8_SYNRA|nr:hypothetical protein BCR43DRAFT_486005 [Syncephalastrum racemosum]